MTRHGGFAPDSRPPEVLILLSGGIDSAACAHFYRHLGRPTCAMHIQYGQGAAQQELAAARQVADYFTMVLHERTLAGVNVKGAGEVAARNSFLICAAVMERPTGVAAVALGIHAGTTYPDCSPEFVERMNALLTDQGVRVEILAPFIDWQKGDVLQYCEKFAIPIDLTYSCERGGTPCGECLSCRDRRALDARA